MNEEPDYFDDFLSDLFYMAKDEESLKKSFENMRDMEENLQKTSDEIKSLTDVFLQYSKDELKQLAQLHNFTRYSRFNKKELAEWLKNSDSRRCIEQFTSSLYLWWLQCIFRFSQIPLDVQEKYKKICTPEFYEELNQNFLVMAYLRSAIYLYGAVSIKDLEMLYEHYEGKKLPTAVLQQMVDELREYQETYCIIDDILMDEDLAEHDLYQKLLKVQSAYPKYIPDECNRRRIVFSTYGVWM